MNRQSRPNNANRGRTSSSIAHYRLQYKHQRNPYPAPATNSLHPPAASLFSIPTQDNSPGDNTTNASSWQPDDCCNCQPTTTIRGVASGTREGETILKKNSRCFSYRRNEVFQAREELGKGWELVPDQPFQVPVAERSVTTATLVAARIVSRC